MITLKKSRARRAMSTMEVMVAGVVLLIAVIGTSSYRYHAALGARHADLFSTGVRITLLLCEGWSGEGGSLTYDPVSTFSPDLDIADGNTAGAPTGFTELGSYEIIVNDFSYYATLSWKNMGSGITSLHVVTRWGNGAAENAGQSYRLTTYVKTGS